FVSFGVVMFQIGLLWFWHSSLGQLVTNIALVNCLNLAFLTLFHFTYDSYAARFKNLRVIEDLKDLFKPSVLRRHQVKDTYRILIFNWRDKRHSWAGGAELYIQEIADRFVQKGHHVTLFCGNDGLSPRNEKV